MPTSSSTLLRDTLRSRSHDLAIATDAIIQLVTPLLWHTLSTFPSGTSHTPHHTATVEQIAGMLIQPELIQQLTDDELQLLILACHFHDLGMVGTEFENQSVATQEQARRDHAIRIGHIIISRWAELGFPNETLAELLAEVCRGHRPEKLEGRAHWHNIRETGIVAVDRPVRLRVLSALIYAADELHLGADRAPKREQAWLQIENQESRRHWRRHQLIAGPVSVRNTLTFEARPTTLVVEDDLRKQVFRKAFSAVRDANSQLTAGGIAGQLPQPRVNWLRNAIWQLVLLQVQSDHTVRTQTALCEQIHQRFVEMQSTFDLLLDVTASSSSEESTVIPEIERVVGDFKTRGYLIEPPAGSSGLVLTTDPRSCHLFFDLVRDADGDDVLFAGRYASHHEFDLMSSPFGHSFAKESVVPVVESGFGVNLATEPKESPVLQLLQTSPTATRLLMDIAPAPSVLVKRHLLHLVVLTGTSLDLLRKPELILTQAVRHAVRFLTTDVASNHSSFLSLIEELALVGGYTYDQIHAAMLNSSEALTELSAPPTAPDSDSSTSTVTLQITQSIPQDLPATTVSFPYLALAGMRAGVTVEMQNTAEAPIKINVDGSLPRADAEAPATRIAIGPGKPSPPARVDMRATFTFDPDSRVGEFLLYALADPQASALPITVSLPIAQMTTAGANASTRLSHYLPAMSAQLLSSFSDFVACSKSGLAECRMVAAKDRRILATQKCSDEQAAGLLSHPFGASLIEFLKTLPEPAFLPWLNPNNELAILEGSDIGAKSALFEKYRSMNSSDKAGVTSVTLRCATGSGTDIWDEYLGFFPKVVFGPPTIESTTELTQEELNRQWSNPAHPITLGAYVTNDHYDLAGKIRYWAENPKQPFPLDISSGSPSTPVFRTQFEIVVYPHIDRLWYVEHPVVLRLRPIRRIEHWEVEMNYWESIGDHERATLLRERLAGHKTRNESGEAT